MEAKNSLFARFYGLLVRAAKLLQSPVLLALRLYWGWQFFVTGRGHLENLGKTTDFFQSLHIPLPRFNACLAGGTECVGGLLLLVGLGSRLISIPLIFTMIIAYVTAESDSLKQIFSDPDKFVSATPFLFMLACVIILAFGPGVFSLDWLIEKKVKPRGNT
ncbi:MAG TPA: DoxX family protein [Verrucomicrobiae bacterium]|jgi:putative oxidoreductase|nr:DoxX family protein [Verrucomicrobiae bacterium]